MRRAPPRSRRVSGAAPALGAGAARDNAPAPGNQATLRRLGVSGTPRIGDPHAPEEIQAERAARTPGPDLPGVRVHRTPQAQAAALALGAQAFTLGRDIYVGPGAPPPDSPEGRALMAHEMAHVAQGDGVLRRQHDAASRGPAFNEALGAGDYAQAVQLLGEMEPAERDAALGALSATTLFSLHAAAATSSESSAVAHAIEDAIARAPREAGEPLVERPVSMLTAEEKLARAGSYALDELGPSIGHEIANLFTPASLAIMAGFFALYLASQLTPAGWLADLLLFVLVAATVIMLGIMIIQILADLLEFFGAVNATSDEQLRAAGHALARAIARAGVGVIVMLITHGLSRGLGPPGPRGAPAPEPGFSFAGATAEGAMMPIPEPAPAVVAAAPPTALELAASYAAMVPPPGGAGPASGGGGGAGPTPRGPEVFEELSQELGLETGEGASGPTVADAVADAQAAGWIDASGRPIAPVDLAVQSHGSAPAVRGELGVTGADANSAHIAPTSGVRGVAGYSRGGALTTLMDAVMHRAFDAHWQQWAIALRRAGRVDVSVAELYAEMLSAIEQIPGMAQEARNALAWRLQLELFSELGLQPTDRVALPYPNIPPAP